MAGKKVLLVEGNDDEHVVKNICGRFKIEKIDTFQQADGIEKLLTLLPVQLQESDISALGVIVDADTDMEARWHSIKQRLAAAGYSNIPEVPDENGTILTADLDPLLPKVGIWLMPNNQLSGVLEDFLRFLVPPEDTLLSYAKETIDSLPHKKFSNTHTPKALMHTWLAWQTEPGKPYGQAIKARYLDVDLPLGTTFANWLREIFIEQ